MKHLFVVNPIAGGGKGNMEKAEQIRQYMEKRGEEFEVYITSRPMDAAEKVMRDAAQGGELRVYACGGDGTLNECVHGAAGFKNAAVTHYPCGTGNDFIRMFGDDAQLFRDLDALMDGEVMAMDVIDCNGRKCINICSVGIDARIGCDVHKYSNLPLVSGSGAYIVSAVVNLLKGINTPLSIKANGYANEGDFSLVCVCNGRYYGGGFNPSVNAMPNDGDLEMLVATHVNIFTAAKVIGKYATGRAAELPELVTILHGKKIEITSPEDMAINIDGELMISKTAAIHLVPGGVNFLVPKGMKFFQNSAENAKTAQ